MSKDFSRTQRVADQIQRELADMIKTEVKDPRVGMITITGVEVTRDYAHAKIFYTSINSNKENNITIEEGLKHANGFLRSQLSSRMRLRVIPQLHFIYDESVERGLYLSRLIDEAIGKN
ncbi:30S ribosome-binding factor RbfA [Nitrosomonas sp. Nm132]|jgi:ribosome-binding factor A|uniref:30S ribosome-binding factor RbfA n=1 Tax=Nitrosomonas sp. Nm132 TaxID=1881053 RepID=UPI00088D2D68|nr:30S ribosome-binding factor RbfA [Nitrosomonas sp. Nm132]SDH40958.1 ribosome-binding factor A [Nitrosomonas sp. Nm132]